MEYCSSVACCANIHDACMFVLLSSGTVVVYGHQHICSTAGYRGFIRMCCTRVRFIHTRYCFLTWKSHYRNAMVVESCCVSNKCHSVFNLDRLFHFTRRYLVAVYYYNLIFILVNQQKPHFIAHSTLQYAFYFNIIFQ